MEKKVLIIGAGGFIGGHIAGECLSRGWDTWTGVRASTSRRYIDDRRLHPLVLDYDDPEALESALSSALPAGDRWDYIIYNLGATKCANFADFNRINFEYLRTFTAALEATSMVPEHFLFMSSLSAVGPGDEKSYTPLSAKMIPQPNTRYGVSKIKAETHLQTLPWLPWTIFRPTGVYGPHEKDYLMMIKCIDRGWDFGIGYRKQLLTFIYVEDLARAICDALSTPATIHKTYIISEDQTYTQGEFREIVARALGRRVVIPVRLPLWSAWIASAVAEKIAAAKMKASTLNRDKFRIMKQRNWACDISDATRDFGFKPRVNLSEGIRRTVEAYRAEKKKEK